MTVTALEHVLVLSDDIEATRQFYCRVVGLRVGERPPLAFPGYWLYAGATPCLHVADRGAYLRHAGSLGLPTAAGDRGAASVDHIAFNAADVERLKEQLERTGVAAVHNTVPNGGPHQVFIEDPNGVRIEINVSSGP